MPDRELLETYPLYRSKEILLPFQRHRWPRPAIKAACQFCKSDQTYNLKNDYEQYDVADDKRLAAMAAQESHSSVIRLVYECAACQRTRRYFMILVAQAPLAPGRYSPPPTEGKATVRKVGQYPPYDIAPDPDLAQKLGPKVEWLKKGLVSESQGYGIGAFAYYRRIVEELIDELLDDIADLVPDEDRDEYSKALALSKSSHMAADKIELVTPLLPPSLRPKGANPLALLHGILSKGIHSLSDEKCLEAAISIREVLVFLVHQVQETKASADRFAMNLKKLLDERARGEGA